MKLKVNRDFFFFFFSNSVQDRKDSIAKPMYRLIGEVFELKGGTSNIPTTIFDGEYFSSRSLCEFPVGLIHFFRLGLHLW